MRKNNIWTQEAYIKPSNAGNSISGFGSSLALDGNTLAIGAKYEYGQSTTLSMAYMGAVYVFVRDNGVWKQEAHLKSTDSPSYNYHRQFDYFGHSLALDKNTLAVGATNEDGSNPAAYPSNKSTHGSGAVYIFKRTASHWSKEAYLKASNKNQNDNFGYSLALDGNTLAVGAINESSSAVGINGNQSNNATPQSGAVYIFSKSKNQWRQSAYIKASNTSAYDHFGSAIALKNNVLAVSATSEDSRATGINGDQTDNSATNSGAVYIFIKQDKTWAQKAYLKPLRSPKSKNSKQFFGGSIALDNEHLAIGTPGDNNAGSSVNARSDNTSKASGAVYLQKLSSHCANQLCGIYVSIDGTEAHCAPCSNNQTTNVTCMASVRSAVSHYW